MHRNDWLPVASLQQIGDWTAVPILMCSGRIAVSKFTYEMTDLEYDWMKAGRFLYEGRDRYRWWAACIFRDGHPGECGTKLPDIFLPDGRVKPQIERLLQNRRKTHGTLDTTPDG